MQPNVIPSEIVITFDFRISPTWSEKEAEDFIDRVCRGAGDEVEYEYICKGPLIPETPLTPENKWWMTFKRGCDEA